MEEERNRLKRDTIERKKKSPKSAFAIVGAKRKIWCHLHGKESTGMIRFEGAEQAGRNFQKHN